MSQEKRKVLFLCTGNTCRSQMAEGWTRYLHPGSFEPQSAGINPGELNPLARTVMQEAGVDISLHVAKPVEAVGDTDFDYVITVCDNAREACPVFPGQARIIHYAFPDPPELAEQVDTEEEKLDCYRRVCDEIRRFAQKLPEFLNRYN